MTDAQKPGRPPIDPEMRRTGPITVRLTPQDRAWLYGEARASGIAPAELVREYVRGVKNGDLVPRVRRKVVAAE